MPDVFPRRVWVVSREYAGIAEAGGVKNVACSLCEGLAEKGIDVTLLIPRYCCTDFSSVVDYTPNCVQPRCLVIDGQRYTVSFDSGSVNGVNIIFIIHQIFSDKHGVYTYTAEDEANDSRNRRGTGFSDELLMDVLFQKAVVAFRESSNECPDVIHCQDAATAFIPALARLGDSKNLFEDVKFVITIHNAGPGYHHNFHSVQYAAAYTGLTEEFLSGCLNNGSVEPFLAGGKFSALTTVSPWYAKELTAPANSDTAGLSVAFHERHMHITGITNGIDCKRYNPMDTNHSLLPYPFNPAAGDLDGKYRNRDFFLLKYAGENASPDDFGAFVRSGFIYQHTEGAVYFCYHGRIVRQKGIDVLATAAANVLSVFQDARFIIVGQGEVELENNLAQLADAYAGRCVYFRGYDRAVARLSTSVSDFIVLPSKFEPCGLEDFIAQLYGTIPVAHATGGLKKILDGKTGFLYTDNTPERLTDILVQLYHMRRHNRERLDEIITHAASYVESEYSWGAVIDNGYMPFYKALESLL